MPFNKYMYQTIRDWIDANSSWSKNDAEIARDMNDPTVPNPLPPPQVPRPVDLDRLVDAIPAAGPRLIALKDFMTAVRDRDMPLLQDVLTRMYNAGFLTGAQATAIYQWVDQYEDDPNHPALVPAIDTISGNNTIEAGDIQAVREHFGL